MIAQLKMCENIRMDSQVMRGRIVLKDSIIEDGVITVEGQFISHICPASDFSGELPESSGSTFLPGLVDVHCHGGGGESFPNATTP